MLHGLCYISYYKEAFISTHNVVSSQKVLLKSFSKAFNDVTNWLSGIPHYQETWKRKYSFHVSIKIFPDNKSAFKGFR